MAIASAIIGVFVLSVGIALRYPMLRLRKKEERLFRNLFAIPPKQYPLELDPFLAQLMGATWLVLAVLFHATDRWASSSFAVFIVEFVACFSPPPIAMAIVKRVKKAYSRKP